MRPSCWSDLHYAANLDYYAQVEEVCRIPQLLHVIWVGRDKRPSYVDDNIEKWRSLMPHWTVRVWTNEDIGDACIPLEIQSKIRECTQGAQMADIMRYFAVYHYGGIYMDADMSPKRSLDPIIYDLNGADLLVCHERDLTWNYVANAFIAATREHPVLKRACEMMHKALINRPQVHLDTGPQKFGQAISEDLHHPKKYAVLEMQYFFGDDSKQFAKHEYANTWS